MGRSHAGVAVDLAVMLADGGEAIADLAVLRNQAELFGSVASDATAWRVLYGIDPSALARIRAARAQARELAWTQAAETGRLTASRIPPVGRGPRLSSSPPGASLITCAFGGRPTIAAVLPLD